MAGGPGPAAALQRLARLPARLAAAIQADSARQAQLDRRPDAGGLTPRERMALLADLELNVRWTAHAARILREDAPALAPVEPEVRALEHAYRHQDPRVAVGADAMARKHPLAELAPLRPGRWARTARSADGTVLTLAAWLERVADEDDAHLAAIEASLREG